MATPALAKTVNGSRKYKFPGHRNDQYVYYSVTHTVRALAADALINWAAKVTAERAVETSVTWLQQTTSEALSYLKKAHIEQMEAGGKRGTETHEYMERRLAGAPAEPATGYERGVDAFISAARPEPELVEVTVFNDSHLYAGTADFVGYFRGLSDHRTLADWKTSKGFWPEHQMQVAAYAWGGEFYVDDTGEHPWKPPQDVMGVNFDEDGGYTIHQLPTDDRYLRAFRACLELRKWQDAGLTPTRVEIPQDWNEVWLRQWLDDHRDRQVELSAVCVSNGIPTHNRRPEDTARIIAIIQLLEMAERETAP